MHPAFLACSQNLLIEPHCTIRDGAWESPMPPKAPYSTCLDALALRSKCLKGLLPLPWRALGHYAVRLRQLLRQVRQQRQGKALSALFQLLSDILNLPATALLVPIKS